MGIEGVYYSQAYWEQKGTLWVYRFYEDGGVIFTTAHDRQRFLLPAAQGEDSCWPRDILGTGEKKEQFLRFFVRDFPLKRGRFDAIIPLGTQCKVTRSHSSTISSKASRGSGSPVVFTRRTQSCRLSASS